MVADEPRYRIVTNFGSLYPVLTQAGWSPALHVENERFKKATLMGAQEFYDIVSGFATVWLPARQIVNDALSNRSIVHVSNEILKLQRFCPWQEHLFDLEEEELAFRSPLTKYIIFVDGRGSWRVQAMPRTRGSFENRLPLPKAWRGLRDDALSEVSGIPGCVFVHATGFIGGNMTENGALEMATRALALGENAP